MRSRHAWMVAVATLLATIASGTAEARNRPPVPKVEFVQPAAGQTLNGVVDLQIKITAPEGSGLPSDVYACFSGVPWTKMERVADKGEWKAALDSTLVPNGDEQLKILTSNSRARGLLKVKVENPLLCYFADLHSHTSYSDGTLLPAVAHDYARNVAKLDVFSLTDHLEYVDEAEWLDTREQAFKANEDGAFVAIPGLEWTKKHGHTCIYDPQTLHWPEETGAFYEAAAAAGVVVKFNHPGDGTAVFDGLAYSAVGDKAVQLMEVRMPKEEQAFIRALDLGWHIAPEGSDDTHSANWGNVRCWTGLFAPGLSQRNVLDALAKRRTFSTHDRNCTLLLKVNGAIMGDIIAEPVNAVEIAAVVDEADEKDTIAKIELFEDGKVVQTDEPNAADRRWETTASSEAGAHYYFVRVTQADGNMLWSAPVWLTVAK